MTVRWELRAGEAVVDDSFPIVLEPARTAEREITITMPAVAVKTEATITLRILRNGEEIRSTEANALRFSPEAPGVYRVEAYIGEKPWIYSNPIYLRGEDGNPEEPARRDT